MTRRAGREVNWRGHASALSVALASASLLVASVATAQPATTPKSDTTTSASHAKPLAGSLTGSARADYDAAKVLFADGDMKSAIVKFQSAYDSSKDARLLWNIAACEKNQRHYAKVLAYIERYKREAGPQLSASELRDADETIAAITPFTGKLAITVNEAGATVFVDDERVGVTPMSEAVRADIGQRRVRVTKEGFREASTTENVAGSGDVVVKIALAKEVHEGRLAVNAGAKATVSVDGTVVGTGPWEGALRSGGHAVRITEPGMRPDSREVLVQDNQTRLVSVTLEPNPASVPPDTAGLGASSWAILIGGSVIIVGSIVVGAVILGKSDAAGQKAPVAGTISPGTVQLPLRW